MWQADVGGDIADLPGESGQNLVVGSNGGHSLGHSTWRHPA
jgi:hypothetical protein